MSKHTQGPWKVVSPKEGGCLDQKENRLIGTTVNNSPYHIAETFQYRNREFNTPDGVSIANARLIAAAPDLLEALQAVKLRLHFVGLPSEPMNDSGPDWSKEIKLLEGAIAKTINRNSEGSQCQNTQE